MRVCRKLENPPRCVRSQVLGRQFPIDQVIGIDHSEGSVSGGKNYADAPIYSGAQQSPFSWRELLKPVTRNCCQSSELNQLAIVYKTNFELFLG